MSQATAQIPDRAPVDIRLVPAPPVETLPTALLTECTCPDWCERDHDRD